MVVRDVPLVAGTPPAAPTGHDVTRRTWLRGAGIGLATVAVAATGVGSYRLVDTAALDPGGGDAYAPWQQWRDTPGATGAVGAAILAASPHNTQPWLFELTDTTIDLSIDGARNLGSIDPYRREQHIALGCTLENLVLACRARGLEPSVRLLPDGPGAAHVVHVDLRAALTRSSPLYDAIGDRHTDRGPYSDRPVSADTRESLVDTTDLDAVAVRWITDDDVMATMGALLVDAAAAVSSDEQQSRDSFAWFRGNNDAVQRHRDGATLDAQGLSPLVLAAGKLLPESSRSAGDTFWVDQTRDVHTRTAAAYGVIVGADPYDAVIQLEAGRLLQRVHLEATSQGVAFQPMNQITERIDREKTTGAATTFGPRFAALLPAGDAPLLAFRVGYPTPRRPAEPAATRDGGDPVTVVGAHWTRILLTALGVCELVVAFTAGSPVALVVGILGGLILMSVPWLVGQLPSATLVALLVVATVPFAALTWWTVVTPLSALLALAIGLPLVIRGRRATASTTGRVPARIVT